MSRERPTNLAASVADRLLQRTRITGEDHQLLLTRYGLERLMYRLSLSEAADQFVVKGALVFLVWRDDPFRMTRDLDLMATRQPSADQLLRLFRSLCLLKVVEDGVEYDEGSVAVTEIREDQQYGGFRVTMRGRLAKIRLPIQVDIGFGDAMTPEAKPGWFPVLLDFPAPMLRLYSKETVVAEKAEAMVQLGLVNSRMKDYYDLWILLREFEFNGELLKTAIHATFVRRKTPLPFDAPAGLTEEYSENGQKQSQWDSFLRRTHAKNPLSIDFKTLVKEVRGFLLPPMLCAGESKPFNNKWPKGGPWQAI
jgi:hypothetical protein